MLEKYSEKARIFKTKSLSSEFLHSNIMVTQVSTLQNKYMINIKSFQTTCIPSSSSHTYWVNTDPIFSLALLQPTCTAFSLMPSCLFFNSDSRLWSILFGVFLLIKLVNGARVLHTSNAGTTLSN